MFPQAKDKEERLLKRQQNRERMEEKRKQKAAQAEEQGTRLLLKRTSRDLHLQSRCPHCPLTSEVLKSHFVSRADQRKQKGGASLEGPRAKEARKERKVLEKKMALNRKRKLDSR